MSKSDVFHLGLTKNDLQGATLAIVPGDPERVEKIAALMDKPVKLASHREFTSWRAELDGKPVIVCSTGIGGPSTSIAVEELAQLGVRTFLRIGTTGAIQPHINVGDVLVTTASVRLDGASLHFAPMEFPAVADFACTTALVEAAKSWRHHPYRRDRLFGYLLPGPGALRHLLRPRGEPLQRLNGRVAGNGRDEL
jgi:uridine phosphorylase